jgi:hypothetical protein
MVIVIALMKNHTDETILSGGFCILDWLEEEVVEYSHVIENVVEKPVLDFDITHFLNVFDK